MTSTITKSKSQRLFDTLDADKDGVIAMDDFEQAAQRIIAPFRGAETPKSAMLRECYLQVWQDLAGRCDTDRSGQVTSAEFENVFAHADMGDTMRLIENAAAAEFALADLDDDGVLAVDELIKMLASIGVPPHEAVAALSELDTDGDGQLVREEYIAAVRDFYTSEDPSSAASRLFGQVRV